MPQPSAMLAALAILALFHGTAATAQQPNGTRDVASDDDLALLQVKANVHERTPAEQQTGAQVNAHERTPVGQQTGAQALRGMLHGLSTAVQQLIQCNERHPEDLYRPIRQVLAEHPGVDGNCYFHFYADYLGTPASHAESFKATVEQYSLNAGKGEEVTLHLTNGEDLITHLDGNWGLYPYDDAMCYMMGWMKGQRLDAHVMDLLDEKKWREVSAAECARLPHMVEGGLDENSTELTIGYMADDNDRICKASECLVEPRDAPCTKATLKDYVYHLYPKCLLNEGLTGASGQVAWCFARACVTEGKVIKHGNECWPEGLPF